MAILDLDSTAIKPAKKAGVTKVYSADWLNMAEELAIPGNSETP